eukprot:TRINITY_DN6936_c0_g1_i1.p1 TRINITY_DN6936_c0_g1~~TRINITY_DN6936_c0_g1_i1.p1  ORF type:complete len:107 (+),score=12.89 TRINITY_DN6936_c0_g1_i1:76-396(+)
MCIRDRYHCDMSKYPSARRSSVHTHELNIQPKVQAQVAKPHHQPLQHTKTSRYNPILKTERMQIKNREQPLTARNERSMWEEESDTSVIEERFRNLEDDIVILNRR